jgi:two-component system, LuxR family, response regulator FixJ
MESIAVEANPTVFIVDDDPAVRQAMAVLVRSMHLQAEVYDSAQQFLDAIDVDRPGCLLLDVRMPGISGLELLERLCANRARIPAIVMSAYGDVPMVVRAMKAGALNFLEKPCRDQQLWEAIQEGLKWGTIHRREAALQSRASDGLQHLTPGEHDVLRLLIDGKSNKTIAAELDLSVRTIEVRRAKLMKKMNAESLAELIRLALAATPQIENTPPLEQQSLPKYVANPANT